MTEQLARFLDIDAELSTERQRKLPRRLDENSERCQSVSYGQTEDRDILPGHR